MKQLLTFAFFAIAFLGYSQVTFIIESLPVNTPVEDDLFIAGSFNNWNAGDDAYKLHKNETENWQITLEAQADGSTIEFKFTRGDWGTVEKDEAGNEMANRSFTFGNGETVSIEIANWADLIGGNTTAAENVSILDSDFYIPQLDRYRRIWIYLPPDYEASNKSYPVLYMHDGQNLFDTYTAFAGEWEVDETLNDLASEGVNVPIVVGIDNGGAHRMNEYSAWVNSTYGGGEGEEYIQFIAETLKPHIDENYRTKQEAVNTGIMGSSLGGFISQYAVLQYSNIFSRGGLFSPSYWYSDSVWAFTEEFDANANHRIYQLMGGEEGTSAIEKMNEMHELLTNQGFASHQLSSTVVPGQGHNEAFWRSEFREAYLWLFDDFVNGIEDANYEIPLKVYPNPTKDFIYFQYEKVDSLRVYDSFGKLHIEETDFVSQKLDVQQLKPGLYFIELKIDSETFVSKLLKL